MGESISVVGNMDELGNWIDYKCHLTWTEGHIWKSTDPIIVNKPFFEYKYVLLMDGQVTGWEEGVNRIADLDALPEVKDPGALIQIKEKPTHKNLTPDELRRKNVKHCQFDDHWE